MKFFHNDLFDSGLSVITAVATAGTLKLVLNSQAPASLLEASTLYDGTAGKYRVSSEVAVAAGDVSIADAAGGGREVTVAAKSGTVAANLPTIDSGTATSGAATSLTDSSKAWTVDAYANKVVKITGGTGAGQVRTITSNTATALTVPAWTTNPDATSVYEILEDLHYALYDDTRLLYVSDESSNQSLTSGNPINFPSFKFGFGDPV